MARKRNSSPSARSYGQRARSVTRSQAANLARSKGFGGKGG
ncbi:MAG TPA: hypothetical protein PLU16_15630 [Gallionellaceae bacterium]|jgi:hypothetical protein|nr:hypothetical protein [Gallionellaceae bacterium]HQS76633.1 hypothetical protein [Gallionellaceae bacterium]